MTTYIYPDPQWVDDSIAFYDETFEKKLRKLSGAFGYEVLAMPEWGIEEDIYMFLEIDAGKLVKFSHVSKEYAYDKAKFVLSATPPAWKRVLTKKDKFVGAFMGGRIKLKKGNTIGALSLGPHANNLVSVLTQVELKYPDDISSDELTEFKTYLAKVREERGI